MGRPTRHSQLVGAAVAAALSLAGATSQAAPLQAPIAYERAEVAGGGLFVVQRSGRTRLLARRGQAPAWSPDGRRVAYVAPGARGSSELFVVDADGRHRGPLTRTPGADEVMASWSPDGRRLVVERNLRLFTMGADGRGERLLLAGREPAWAPKTGRIAYVSDREGTDDLYVVDSTGRGARRLTTTPGTESEPVWSPDGLRLAFVSQDAGFTDLYVIDVQSRELVQLTQGSDPAVESSPAWSRTGEFISFVSDRTDGGPVWGVNARGGVPISLGGPASVGRFRYRPAVTAELRPDLDQRPPTDLSFQASHLGGRHRYLLGFTSASDNIGEGPLVIAASRPSTAVPTMRADQLVRVAGGGRRTYPGIGFLRFTIAPPHQHWHLMDFQRYELRKASDHTLVVRDRKSGFCLTDHWGQYNGSLPGKPREPVFLGNCAQLNRQALAVFEGTSVGYTDRYPAYFHGQNLDVTHVPAGIYVLVHRANANLSIRELRYENNASSLRIRLSWPGGRPALKLLRVCATSEYCEAAQD